METTSLPLFIRFDISELAPLNLFIIGVKSFMTGPIAKVSKEPITTPSSAPLFMPSKMRDNNSSGLKSSALVAPLTNAFKPSHVAKVAADWVIGVTT